MDSSNNINNEDLTVLDTSAILPEDSSVNEETKGSAETEVKDEAQEDSSVSPSEEEPQSPTDSSTGTSSGNEVTDSSEGSSADSSDGEDKGESDGTEGNVKPDLSALWENMSYGAKIYDILNYLPTPTVDQGIPTGIFQYHDLGIDPDDLWKPGSDKAEESEDVDSSN